MKRIAKPVGLDLKKRRAANAPARSRWPYPRYLCLSSSSPLVRERYCARSPASACSSAPRGAQSCALKARRATPGSCRGRSAARQPAALAAPASPHRAPGVGWLGLGRWAARGRASHLFEVYILPLYSTGSGRGKGREGGGRASHLFEGACAAGGPEEAWARLEARVGVLEHPQQRRCARGPASAPPRRRAAWARCVCVCVCVK